MFAWFDAGWGRKVYRRVPEPRTGRSDLACPMLIRPFSEPVQSMADGNFYDTPRDLERTYKASGNPRGEEFTPLGNETMLTVEIAPDPRQRRDHVKQAMHDVLTGNLSPDIAAIQ